MDPGSLVRELRRRHGLTQDRLAVRAGTSQAFISRVERGELSPTIETLERLLASMGERLTITTERLPGMLDDDPEQLRDARALTPSERLERAMASSRFAASIHGAAARR
ncbi:MAG: helix-turn-helix domain-containing protein [Solirubrobacteraceae bacterium]|nr:helix-turn-helix domain-containing protein [Solirubrobacteraceae bacterium]